MNLDQALAELEKSAKRKQKRLKLLDKMASNMKAVTNEDNIGRFFATETQKSFLEGRERGYSDERK